MSLLVDMHQTKTRAERERSRRSVILDAALDTHWSRVLYSDVVAADASCDATVTGKFTRAELRPPANDFAIRHSSEKTNFRCEAERVTLRAADGYAITAVRYAPAGPTRAHLIVAGAIGVPQRFYRPFAEFAASAGYSTMTLDYRGVGLSAPASLSGFKMNYFDWGRLDLAAAVSAMGCPEMPLYIVGHSFGGHAFGMLPNHQSVAALYTFGTGAGWHGWMPPLERIKVLAMWHLLGPVLTRWKGYLSWSLLGMGEDLPLDFYRQWKHWCRYPNFFFGDPSVRHVVREFDKVRTPLMAANSIDDQWAPPRSRDAFIAGYKNAARQTLDINPSRAGLGAIGHMGYFKRNAMPLWRPALEWLATQRSAPSARTVAPTSSPALPVSYEPSHADRAHRAFGLRKTLSAGVRAAGAIARRAHGRYQQRREARSIYNSLRHLDDRTLSDLGFDRSEIKSVAAEFAGLTEKTRAHTFAQDQSRGNS